MRARPFLAAIPLVLATLLPPVPASAAGGVVGGRPPGCPARYCGCGASLEVFGRIVPGLNLARAWYRFPRSAPGYNTVGVRPGHVFVLKEHIRDDLWMVKDYNSGRGLTRYHPRSIRGYTIVRPGA